MRRSVKIWNKKCDYMRNILSGSRMCRRVYRPRRAPNKLEIHRLVYIHEMGSHGIHKNFKHISTFDKHKKHLVSPSTLSDRSHTLSRSHTPTPNHRPPSQTVTLIEFNFIYKFHPNSSLFWCEKIVFRFQTDTVPDTKAVRAHYIWPVPELHSKLLNCITFNHIRRSTK